MKTALMVVVGLGTILGAGLPTIQESGASVVQARGDLLRLRAKLTSSGLASGNADYRETDKKGTIVRNLKVEIEDAAANTTFDVMVDGQVIGQLTTNEFGTGERRFRTQTNNPGGPTPLPPIGAGAVVSVGPVSGTLN